MVSDADTPLHVLRDKVLKFRDDRDWQQFHHPKDLVMALAIEAAELMEPFRFKTPEQATEDLKGSARTEVAQEMADVLYFLLLLAHEADVDLSQALEAKLAVNAQKYPVERSRGRNLKYTHYQ